MTSSNDNLTISRSLEVAYLADHPDAIQKVAEWYYHEWGRVPGNSVGKTIERINGKLNRESPPFHILALWNGDVVGVAQFKLREMKIYPDKEFWLGSLFVAPHARGRGIGSALAEYIAGIAANHGVKELYLQTEALDGGLYRKIGWQLVECVYYNNVDVAVMVRHLTPRIYSSSD